MFVASVLGDELFCRVLRKDDCSSTAERMGGPIFHILWLYVVDISLKRNILHKIAKDLV